MRQPYEAHYRADCAKHYEEVYELAYSQHSIRAGYDEAYAHQHPMKVVKKQADCGEREPAR